MRVALLFLVCVPLAHALNLRATSRVAYPSDIRDHFLLQEATDDSPLCPLNVTHTTWSIGPSGHIELPHNTIIHDNVRCNSLASEKVLVFYESDNYNPDLSPKSDAVDPLPDTLVDVVAISGYNIDALHAGFSQSENFLIGYEKQARYCNAGGNWLSDTTVFLYRPFKPFSVKNLQTPLVPGYKYMLVVPRYASVYCLYSARIPGHPTAKPIITAAEEDAAVAAAEATSGPEPSEQPWASPEMTLDGSETVEMDPVPVSANGRELLEEPMATAEESEPACFPADATVRTTRGEKRMADVRIGDYVATADGLFSRVFAFTHRDERVRTRFVVLRAQNGMQLALSGGHFLYVNDRIASADEVVIGDVLRTKDGPSVVVSVSTEVRVGLFNAQTESGEIVVDGVVATTYTRAIDVKVAHALLTPFRAMVGSLGGEALSAFADGRGRDGFMWLEGVRAA